MDAMQTVVDELRKIHGMPERDAASIAMTVSGVVDIKIKPNNRGTMHATSKCPFREPTFRMRADEPCPVCGVTSDVSSAEIRETCVDP